MKANDVCSLFTVSIAIIMECMNYKRDSYVRELLQLLKFMSLFIYFVKNFRCYKNPLYGTLCGKVLIGKNWRICEQPFAKSFLANIRDVPRYVRVVVT